MTEKLFWDVLVNTLLVGVFLTDGKQRRRWFNRTFRPNSVRRQHRHGIKQAQSILRLIASTHYFEEDLEATVEGMVPSGGEGPFWDAFRHAYWDRAEQLLSTQRAWARAVKPGPHKGDW